jgi:hypothetical protein
VQNELVDEEPLDWSSFVQAYAAGKWDPRHTPKPPRSQHFPGTAFNEVGRLEDVSRTPTFLRSTTPTSNDTVTARKRVPGTSNSFSLSSKLSLGSGNDPRSASTAASSVASTSHSPPAPVPASVLSPTWPHMSLKMRREQNHRANDSSSGSSAQSQPLPKLTMPPTPRGILSRSLSDSSSAVSPAPIEDTSRLSAHESHHDFHAAAATMRLAGDGINVRPLALPSPEVELTDPLRGHTASIALPWPREGQEHIGESIVSSITSSESGIHSRKTRLNSFWNVLDDVMRGPTGDIENTGASPAVHNGHPSGLPTVSASPDGAPAESMGPNRRLSFKGHYPVPVSISPTSAPLLRGPTKPSPDDYFAIPPHLKAKSVVTEAPEYQALPDKKTLLPSIQYLPVFETSPESLTSSGGSLRPPLFNRTVSEPIASSAKLPEGSLVDPTPDNEPLYPRPQSEIIKSSHRRPREEVEYLQRGYLIAPTPPNEWERQKALYKFVQLLLSNVIQVYMLMQVQHCSHG